MKRKEPMAESSASWLGMIPSHWEVKKLKFVAELRTDRLTVPPAGLRYVGLEHIEGKMGRFAAVAADMQTEAESTVNCFRRGDVLFGKLRPYLAKAVVADSDGCCSSEILVFRTTGAHPEYLKNVLLLDGFIQAVNASTFGSKMPRADAGFISQMAVSLPPLEEQGAIATYLDSETARIDALIGAKQALIELLGELRNSLASDALEKGLDPNVPLLESGVPWLGPLPSHWSVKRLKHVLHGIEQGWSPQCDSRPAEPGEWGVLKAGACNGGRFRVEENKAVLEETTPDPSIQVKTGDLLMSRASGSIDLVGSVAYVDAVPPGLMLSDKIFRLRVDHSLHNSPQWLAQLFNTQTQRRQIASFVRGSEGLARNIASTDVKELWIGVPPPSEQLKIVSFVQRKNDQIDELVKHVTHEIEVLRELRSTTITDAVLGRIDVRPTVKKRTELEAA